MTFSGVLAVGAGAALGAWLRWWLGAVLNAVFPHIPLGTLTANLVGGLLMGFAMAAISHYDAMAPELRLLVTTGFLGGLTTFSAFSAETATLVLQAEFGWTAAIVAAHVVGSVVMTLAGLALMRILLAS